MKLSPGGNPSMQLLTLALYATCAAGGFLRRSGERLTPEAAVAEVEAPEAEAVRKPKTDQRRYHHEVWSSGLSVLVVEDPNAQKSSYAMAVEVGSLEDPEDFQGLAHFCEHMVFLGSKKYPAEDQFSDRLAFYGGQNNAYTSADQTVYYAEVDDKGFDQTFDIFAQFFIEPTFSGNMVDREINAVDSEHKKNMPDIGRRLFHLMNSRGNPESPVSKFATGNLKTLKLDPEKAGKSLPQALRRFHQEHYCPSRMHLVIMRNASVAEQLKAAHRSFDVLGRKPCPARPVYDNVAAFSRATGTLGRRLLVHTDGAPQLWLMFPLVSLRGRYKALPEAYINYAMSHYGPGGLKALLKHEDLSLQYSTMTETTPAGTNLFVIFSLTEQGASKPEEVVEHFFAYFAALKAKGATKELLEKLQAMNQVMFDYQEPSASESSYVTQLAGALPSVRPEDVLTGGVLMDEINLTLTGQLLEAIRPQNLNLALATRSFDASAARHEEYYDFNYTEEPLPEALVRRWASASSAALAAPPAPRFVPQALGLISAERRKVPDKLQSEPQLWWLGLGRFQLPKAQLQLKLGFDRSVVGTAARSALAAVHARLVKLALEEPSDAFQMCGLGYGVAAANDGLSVSFSGFNEHLVELVRLVLPVLRRPKISAADFEVARRQLILDLADVTGQQPYQHAMEALEVVTVKNTFSRAATLAAARDEWAVSLGELGAMLDEMFEEPKISMLVTGNIDQDESKQLMAEVQSILAPRRGLLGRLWLRFTHLLFGSSRGSAAYDPLVLDLQKESWRCEWGTPSPRTPTR
ncbi:unnamed protein product [Effrenium voratum]|uniref:Insulin-degrading enzyme n=1 Tax=Effrenium voratum TaxID=2562239 RepID=A0AA36N7E6_9DINO|nr:unnamed protein product [Effrenium voratum]